jgi:hypothetical protein
MSCEWILDGQFLLQRSTVAEPKFPDSIAVIALRADGAGYTQRYFDSRGVVRTYAMTLDAHTWTLQRDRADFTPLHFSQRFTGSLSADGNAITAGWETRHDGERWPKDFDLTYTRISTTATPRPTRKGPTP